MSSVVVTGTGLLTAAGLGHVALDQALAAGRSFVHQQADGFRSSEVSRELLFWPAAPEWQAALEYSGLGAQLAVTACEQALRGAAEGAAAFDPERSATVAVTDDDWTEQQVFDRAISKATSAKDEARALFLELEDPFLLRLFRWSVGFGIGALTGFQGPSLGIDCPSFGGLSGLRQAMDLIESGEVDAVMLVGVDTRPRLDIAVSLEQLARDAGQAALSFGQSAAALMLERSASAVARGARPLARVLDCRLELWAESQASASRLETGLGESRKFSSASALGTLLSSAALVDVCLASQWLASEGTAGRAASAHTIAIEMLGVRGAGLAALGSLADAGHVA